MGKVHRSRDFHIEIQPEEIARILGYGHDPIPDRVHDILDEIKVSANELISTSCAYRYFDGGELASSPYLHGIESAALCLVTICERLEAAVEEEKANGDLSRALILDTYGSAAAEACADAAEAMIKEGPSARGLRCSRRFSPGYSGWDVSEQRWILPALESEALNVRLTEGCMMIPRKSITFAVVIGENPSRKGEASHCDACGLLNCRFRYTSKNEKGEK